MYLTRWLLKKHCPLGGKYNPIVSQRTSWGAECSIPTGYNRVHKHNSTWSNTITILHCLYLYVLEVPKQIHMGQLVCLSAMSFTPDYVSHARGLGLDPWILPWKVTVTMCTEIGLVLHINSALLSSGCILSQYLQSIKTLWGLSPVWKLVISSHFIFKNPECSR